MDNIQEITFERISNEQKCFHCGNPLGIDTLQFQDHSFCCEGCKTVYSILKENNLGTYYELNEHPGSTGKLFEVRKFEILDDPKIAASFLKFSNEEYSIAYFRIPGIHCSSCIWLLENLPSIEKRTLRSVVNFNRKEAFIHFDHHQLSLKELAVLLSKIGYEPLLSLDTQQSKQEKNTDRSFYFKLGVAFFCWGNIMLLSFPEYLGLDLLKEANLRNFFGYLNILLSLPVLLYCSSDFMRSAWNGLKVKNINIDIPIALGIVVMFIRSAYEILSGNGAGYMDTLASLVFLMLVGRRFQNISFERLSFERDYKSYFPLSVSRKEESGEEKQIPLAELKTGDRIIVRNQEIVPADAILFSGEGLVDYSFVTGEEKPVNRSLGEIIYAGGKQTGALIEVEIIRPVSQSYLTQLWNDDSFQKNNADSIQSLTNKVSKSFSIVILIIALAALFYWLPSDGLRAMNAFTAVLIITCPCALALSSPFAMGYMLRGFGRKDFYLKNALVVEKMNEVDTLIFDKTGTLTSDQDQELIYEGEQLSVREWQLLFSSCRNSGHPLSRKISSFLSNKGAIALDSFQEISGKGLSAVSGGQCLLLGSPAFVMQENEHAEKDNQLLNASRVYFSINGKYKGRFLIRNKYRKFIAELLGGLKDQYEIHILSGDNDSEKNHLKQFVPNENYMHFNQSPFDKLNFVKQLQKNGKKVMMIGDGLNDAGALKQSHVGIAVTDSVNNFTPASDAIIDGKQLKYLPRFLKSSGMALNVIRMSFGLSFLYNFIGVYFAVQGTMTPLFAAVLMPLSSVTVVGFITLAVKIRLAKLIPEKD